MMSLCGKLMVVSFVLFLVVSTSAFYQYCPPCQYVTCPPVACNSSSTTWRQYMDTCGCCILCGKNEGEKCGGTNNAGGNCIPGQSCNYRAGITLGDKRMGLCEPDDCRLHACGYRKRCNTVSNRVGCRCPEYRCHGKRNPVCGNDGNTYDSVCHLQQAECTNNKFIGIYHFGNCLPQLRPTTARPTTLSKNELDEEDDLFGQLTQPTVATNEAPRRCVHNGQLYTANNQLVKVDDCLYRVCNYEGVLREVRVPGCQGGPSEPDYSVDMAAVHGGWSEWSMTECEGFCHNGTQERTRTCTNPSPKYEARNCSGATWEIIKCIPSGCEAIVCNYSDWTSWSDCPVTCGTGTQRRTRSLLSPSPVESLCVLKEVKTCTRPKCYRGPCERRTRQAFFTDSRNCTSYRMFPDYYCDGTCSGGGSNCCRPKEYYTRVIPVNCPPWPWYEDSHFPNQILKCSCTDCPEESGEGQLGS